MISINYPFQALDILLLCYAGAWLIQLIYYLLIFSRLAFNKGKPKDSENEIQPVSIVICARNEAANLEKNLPLIMQQAHPDFEVIVVNDCSQDKTYDLLFDLSFKYDRLKVVNFPENFNFFRGKKFPLSLGILCARNEWVLLTDADCKPAGVEWLTTMQRNFTETNHFVLGFGNYLRRKGLLNLLIRFDTFYTALQYFSAARAGIPYMGVGRNLAYRKSVFMKNRGFTRHYLISSGDDDLFINQLAKGRNTSIEIAPEAVTYSEPETTFREWFYQKKRHFSTGAYYKFRHRLFLGLMHFSQAIFFLLFALLLVFQYNTIPVLAFFVFRMLLQLIIFKKSMKRLGVKDLLLLSPLLEVFFLFYNPYVFISNIIRPSKRWKQ